MLKCTFWGYLFLKLNEVNLRFKNINACVTKQYINSIKIAELSSPGKVNTRCVSGKDNGHIWLLRKDKESKNLYIFHDLSVIFSIGLTT